MERFNPTFESEEIEMKFSFVPSAAKFSPKFKPISKVKIAKKSPKIPKKDEKEETQEHEEEEAFPEVDEEEIKRNENESFYEQITRNENKSQEIVDERKFKGSSDYDDDDLSYDDNLSDDVDYPGLNDLKQFDLDQY